MGKRIYGMNRGTVGFLMNRYREEGLGARLEAAQPAVIHPLRMDAVTAAGARHTDSRSMKSPCFDRPG